MSDLKNLKNLSNKQVKRIISLILMVTLGVSSAFTVDALSKDVTIKDGEDITKFRTIHSETNAVLKQAGINVNENDKVVRTDSNSKQVDINIKRAFSVNVLFNGTWVSYTVNDGTVADLLAEHNIPTGDNYHISVEINEPLVPNMQIIVSRLVPINILVAGENLAAAVPEGTVADALKFLNISLSENDEVNESLDKNIEDGMNIVVNRVEFKEITEKEEIPFSTEVRKSESLNSGEFKIEVQGINGEKELTKRVKYVNGNLVQSDVLSESVLKNPVNQIKVVGTKPKNIGNVSVSVKDGVITDENGKSYHYSKVLTGVCTAYSEKPGARTSTGAIARRGLVAVNPKQIPYGTKLYIPGYGICTAADTGGAMRQGRAMIDLYMDSERECRQFGRRTKNVYILD